MSKEISPREEVRNTLEKLSGEFKKALPNHIPVDRFVRVVQTAITTNPQLMTADRTSLWSACTKAAAASLLPDGKEAALVTFKGQNGTTVSFMPMIAGILKLIRNSGELASITSQIVFENDVFEYYIDGDGEHISHRPMMFGDRGKRIGVYALAKTKDGSVYIEVMTSKQVEDVKNVSRSKNSGPWSGPFEEEMWKKTVLRRLSKRLPMSTDIEETIRRDDDLFMPEPVTERVVAAKTQASLPQASETPEPEVKKTSSRLKDAVKAKDVTPKASPVKEPDREPEPEPEVEQEPEYVDRPAIFAEEDNDLDRALGEDTV